MSKTDEMLVYHLVFKRRVTRSPEPQSAQELLDMIEKAMKGEMPQPKSPILDALFGAGCWQVASLGALGTKSFFPKLITFELIVLATRTPCLERLCSCDRPVRIERVNRPEEITRDEDAEFRLSMN